jgi:uncharacterized cupredoxin-like copper-binding protein
MQKLRMSFVVLALAVFAGGAYGQAIVTVDASPLKINIGADGSFQIYNTAVPGVGQVFPTGGSLADMGIFAHIDGALFAPNFRAHDAGTATGALGTFTPWTELGISPRRGAGTDESPYTVSVALAAGVTDVRVTMTVSYVRGNNFFRVRTNFFSTTGTHHEIDATFGADIFLASSDNGIFVSVPELGAVGGHNCEGTEGDYNILLIPITAASRFTASNFSDVWAQIKLNALNNSAPAAGCVDNGAAIQWENVMSGTATSVELSHAVSFGAVPSAANFAGFNLTVDPNFVTLSPGESATLTVTSFHNQELEFNAPVRLSAGTLPAGMTLTFDKTVIPAPGDGTAKATLSVDSTTIFPQLYSNLLILGSGGNEVRGTTFSANILCTPPTILGISQPQSVSVASGAKVKLKVKAEGAGGFVYQWYNGHSPMARFPVAGATSAEFETPAVTAPQEYWVRISNPCGSVDSLTATASPQ